MRDYDDLERYGNFREYIAQVVTDAVTADAVIAVESTALDDTNHAVECKLHVRSSELPPEMLIDALRNCADQIQSHVDRDRDRDDDPEPVL